MPYLLTLTRETQTGEETLLIDSFEKRPTELALTDALLTAGVDPQEEPEIRKALLTLKTKGGWRLEEV